MRNGRELFRVTQNMYSIVNKFGGVILKMEKIGAA